MRLVRGDDRERTGRRKCSDFLPFGSQVEFGDCIRAQEEERPGLLLEPAPWAGGETGEIHVSRIGTAPLQLPLQRVERCPPLPCRGAVLPAGLAERLLEEASHL